MTVGTGDGVWVGMAGGGAVRVGNSASVVLSIGVGSVVGAGAGVQPNSSPITPSNPKSDPIFFNIAAL